MTPDFSSSAQRRYGQLCDTVVYQAATELIGTAAGYVAVFNEDVVRHYQEFLDRRRKVRSADEYKPVTDSE